MKVSGKELKRFGIVLSASSEVSGMMYIMKHEWYGKLYQELNILSWLINQNKKRSKKTKVKKENKSKQILYKTKLTYNKKKVCQIKLLKDSIKLKYQVFFIKKANNYGIKYYLLLNLDTIIF